MPITACMMSKDTPTPWNIGDIRHMSTGPDSSTWPKHKCNVNSGIPIIRDNIKNCIMKLAVTIKKIHCEDTRKLGESN